MYSIQKVKIKHLASSTHTDFNVFPHVPSHADQAYAVKIKLFKKAMCKPTRHNQIFLYACA